MWVPEKVVEWFHLSKDYVDGMREELAKVRAERDAAVGELATTKANFAWLAVRVNALELERGQLIEKVHGIRVAVPELTHARVRPNVADIDTSIFEDMGEEQAGKYGFPSYATTTTSPAKN